MGRTVLRNCLECLFTAALQNYERVERLRETHECNNAKLFINKMIKMSRLRLEKICIIKERPLHIWSRSTELGAM